MLCDLIFLCVIKTEEIQNKIFKAEYPFMLKHLYKYFWLSICLTLFVTLSGLLIGIFLFVINLQISASKQVFTGTTLHISHYENSVFIADFARYSQRLGDERWTFDLR